MDSFKSLTSTHLFTVVILHSVPWFPFSLSVGYLTSVNGIHQWPVISLLDYYVWPRHIYSHIRTCTHRILCRTPSSLVAFHICYLLDRASVHEISTLVIWFQCMSGIFSHYADFDPLCMFSFYGDPDPFYIFIMEILIDYILCVAMTTHVTFCISCLFMAIVLLCIQDYYMYL